MANAIEKTGTFTIDVEPNWNETIQLALSLLAHSSPQFKTTGAQMVRACVEPMIEQGFEFPVPPEADVMCPGDGRDHVRSVGRELETWATLAIELVDGRPSEGRLERDRADGISRRETEMEMANDRPFAVNFIKLIGKLLEENRQARRS